MKRTISILFVFSFLILTSCNSNYMSNKSKNIEYEITPIEKENIEELDNLSEVSATPTIVTSNTDEEKYICFQELPEFDYGILSNMDANDYYEYLTFESIDSVDDIVNYISTLKDIGFNEIEYINTYDTNSELWFRGMNEDEFEISIQLNETTCSIVYGKDYGYK